MFSETSLLPFWDKHTLFGGEGGKDNLLAILTIGPPLPLKVHFLESQSGCE
jgi:hypothetical protein